MSRVGDGRVQFRLTIDVPVAAKLDHFARLTGLTRSEVAEAILDALVSRAPVVEPVDPRLSRSERLGAFQRACKR